MTEVPKLMPTPPSSAIATYSFDDFTTGLGYVTFYCFETEDNTDSLTYHILNTAVKGSDNHKFSNSTITLEFTVDFGVNQIMGGIAYFQFHWGFKNNGNSSSGYATISVEKNGVELATERGLNLTSTSNTQRTEVIKLDIPPTTFTPKDTLKIKIVATDPGTSVNDGLWVAFDPLDTGFTPGGGWTGGAIADTVFKANIPFKIDL